MGELGVVILNWNYWPGIKDCIESVLAQVDRVVIVDNGSDDGSPEKIRAAYPELMIVELEADQGYAAGMNAGARQMEGDLLFVAHDCVLGPGVVEALASRLATSGVGAAGPLITYADAPDRVFSAGGTLRPPRMSVGHSHRNDASEAVSNEPCVVDWVDGSCIAVRREAFDAVGWFDENYFLYFEEVDLCCRIRSAGWTIECVRGVSASQHPGVAGSAVALWTRNRLRFLSRCAPRRALVDQLRIDLRASVKHPERRAGLVGWLMRSDPKRLYGRTRS